MLLSQFLAQYLLARECCPNYAADLATTVRQLEEFAGKVLYLSDLSDDLVNRWLLSFEDRRSKRTIRNKRVGLCTLWRAAYNARLIEGRPERIRVIRLPQTIPVAFMREELLALVAAAESLEGTFSNGVSKRLWWASFFRAAYDTALRLGDLLSVEIPWLWPGGYFSLVQHKTGLSHRLQLHPQTVAMINELCGDRKTGLIWPLWARREQYFWWFRRIRQKAGLTQGTTKWIRRASASYVAAEHGIDAASAHLGHRSRGLAEKHYLDPRICAVARPMPPALG